MTKGVNLAIRECHKDGVVTSATLMANGTAFEDAVTIARATEGLSVGCHVVLVDGEPVLPTAAVPTLVAKSTGRGKFPGSISTVGTRAALGRLDPDQLVREIVAQIEKLRTSGITVTHLDTHKHAHVFPKVLEAVVRAARICDVRAIRNPFVPVVAMRLRQFKGRPRLWKRYGLVRVLRTLAGKFHARMEAAGLATPDGIVGVIETGQTEDSMLRQAISSLAPGTWELVCHPGYDDSDLRSANTRLLESREHERQILISPSFRQFLEEQGIQLIRYADLGTEPR